MRRNITEPYIDLNASVPIITEKYSSLGNDTPMKTKGDSLSSMVLLWVNDLSKERA